MTAFVENNDFGFRYICRVKTGSGGVCCHNARGRVRNRKSNPDGVARGIGVLFAQARVHCDNKPRQIGLNHNYNMTFLISPHGCPYSPLRWRSSRSKREPFRLLLPLLRHVAPLSDGILLSHNAVVKRRCARDAIPWTFHIEVFKCGQDNSDAIIESAMTLWNCWIVVRLFLIPMIGGISYKRRQWLIWGYGDTRLPSLRTRGPKCHTSRAEMSHKQGQNVTQGPKCHTVML